MLVHESSWDEIGEELDKRLNNYDTISLQKRN